MKSEGFNIFRAMDQIEFFQFGAPLVRTPLAEITSTGEIEQWDRPR